MVFFKLSAETHSYLRPVPSGSQLGTTRLRQSPEDFRVWELPSVSPSGVGEHAWLKIRKRGENTDWVAKQLARLAGVRPRDVSYAGLKDRQAVTEQWFSVHLPGKADPDWRELDSDSLRVLEATRHEKKLRRGVLRGNRFEIVLRELDADPAALQARVDQLQAQGWPNYFGAQRFGREDSNLRLAGKLFSGLAGRVSRHKRSLAISAARSLLFNRVLAARVAQENWNQVIEGDVLQLDGRSAVFPCDPEDTALSARLAAFDIHPTGPLWGRGQRLETGLCAALESRALTGLEEWQTGLEQLGAERDRRALRVRPAGLHMERGPERTAQLVFELPAGSYATVLIEQMLKVESGA